MPLTIERLTEATAEAAADINHLLAQLSPRLLPIDAAALEQCLQDSAVFVARDGSRIVGMAALVIASVPGGRSAFLESVVVDDRCRGQGIGERLVMAALELAQAEGAIRVDLTTGSARAAANRLYQRLGFEQRETNVYRFTPAAG